MSKLKVTEDGVGGDGYFVKFKKWFGKLAKAETVPVDDYERATEPTNCPICNSVIELTPDSSEYFCVGCRDRAEVEACHPRGAKLPADVIEIPACGWHARADEWGKTWE